MLIRLTREIINRPGMEHLQLFDSAFGLQWPQLVPITRGQLF